MTTPRNFWEGRFLFAGPNTPEDVAIGRQLMNEMTDRHFEEYIVWVEVRDTTSPPPPTTHNFAPRTNQLVLNLFRDVFGPGYWAVIVRAGLTGIAGNRAVSYSGPDVEALPLTEDEKGRLIAAM